MVAVAAGERMFACNGIRESPTTPERPVRIAFRISEQQRGRKSGQQTSGVTGVVPAPSGHTPPYKQAHAAKTERGM